jgi:mono/diheme cytochrome c family protein
MRGSLPLAVALLLTPLLHAEDAASLWTRKVQPLFDVHCVKCHGPLEQKSGLELDTPEALLKGGESGPVVVPGKPEASILFTQLAPGGDPHMPPKKQLTDPERETIREWIAAMTAAPATSKPAVVETRKFDSIPQAVDTLIAEGWAERHLQPAPAADDRTWSRRVYLDLAGRIPTAAETAAFLQKPADTRHAALVDQLLASAEYPVHMRELWDFFLMGRAKRDNQEERRRKNDWWTFLETAFRTNRPWNDTVHDLLAARPEKPESKGAAWFLYERRNEHQRIAEAVAPIIYGTRVDCAQCHDHPLAREIKQAHYWALVAAFNRSKNVEKGNEVAESAVGGFINFTNLKKESQPALLTLLTGRTVDEPRPAGGQSESDGDDKYVDPKAKVRVPKFSRREALADAATEDNPLLARAFVNRMWATLLGRGIVQPADEMNARNVPSHPALLDWLARDFAGHGYDARRFIRGIVLSRAYGLAHGADPAPEAFAAALERPLSGEQIARSWRIAATLPPEDDALRIAVIKALPDVLPKEFNATFQQAQFLTNSPLLTDLLKPAPGNTAERLALLPDATARARAAFQAAYGRDPDPEEAAQTTTFLQQRPDKPAEAVRDLLWALTTSAEFLTMP